MNLRAGDLTLTLDPDSGFVRYVRLGEAEVLRGIYAAVRDRNWGTVPLEMRDWHLEQTPDSFTAHFTAVHRQGPIHYEWCGEVRGDPSSLSYRFDGEAKSRFERNRIGLCVLHPIKECAGQSCTVEHGDGSLEEGVFPDLISPHQPFVDIRSIRHRVNPDFVARLFFEGEVFEMEDQRNWTDASYKTYGTPLALPRPVWVEVGDRVGQRVHLRLERSEEGKSQKPRKGNVNWETRALPALGLGFAGLDGLSLPRLWALEPSHLRADLDFGVGWEERLRLAALTEIPLELALHLRQPSRDLASLRDRLGGVRVARVLVYQQGRDVPTDEALKAAGEALGGYAVVGGTDTYFAQLNRERFDYGRVDGVCYSVNPQVHAFDDSTLFENLEAQPETVRSAKAFSGKPVVISPVTLRPRFNPEAQTPEEAYVAPDPRQSSELCAAWTLGSVAALTLAGVESVTYFETHGAGGVLGCPVERVFSDLAAFKGTTCEVMLSSSFAAIRFGSTLLAANFRPEPQRVGGLGLELAPYGYKAVRHV